MKKNIENQTELSRFANKCTTSCQKLIEQIKRTKDSLQAEFRETIKAHEQLLHLALNEAEALAWETPYPHLVFPMLAREKAQGVADWDVHQRRIHREAPVLRIRA